MKPEIARIKRRVVLIAVCVPLAVGLTACKDREPAPAEDWTQSSEPHPGGTPIEGPNTTLDGSATIPATESGAVPAISEPDVSTGGSGASGSPEDAAIVARINTALRADPVMRGLALDVTSLNGEVTLSGNVESQDQAMRATEMAKGIAGVIRVNDLIVVRMREETRG